MLDSQLHGRDNDPMRSKVVQTRLSKEQLALVRQAARAEGQTISFYIRETLIGATIEYLKPREVQDRNEQLREQIGKLLRQLQYESGKEMGAGLAPVPPNQTVIGTPSHPKRGRKEQAGG